MEEERDALESILTEMADRIVAGEEVDPFDLIAEHPERAEEIRRELPRLLHLIDALSAEQPGLAPAPDDRAPKGWREIKLLQSGGQGRVLLVEEIATGRQGAFKLLDRSDEGALREALAYDRLRETGDPALVRVYRVYANGILMEYLPGEELWDFVDPSARPGDTAIQEWAAAHGEKGDPYRRLAEAFVGPALGLHRIHRQGILHRDLKPQNVKLEERRGLVLFDLGLARVEGLQTISDPEAVLGTIPFLAPEALPGADQAYSERTDVYGLGATLYTLLTNRPPHEGKDYFACLEAARNKAPQPPRSYNPAAPAGLVAIVDKAMAREPKDRYDSALEMAQDLERFANGQVPWAEIGFEALAKRSRKRRRVAAVVLVMALVGGLATWHVVKVVEDAARAERVDAELTRTDDLLGAHRAPEAEKAANQARDVPALGFEEMFACNRREAAALRAMGRFEDAVTLWGRRLQHVERRGERRPLLESLADTLHEDTRHEAVVRVIHRIEGRLSDEMYDLLLESLLRLGHEAEARGLMAERKDTSGLGVLDRFAKRLVIPLPHALSVASIPMPDGTTALIAGLEDGSCCRLHPDRQGAARIEPLNWDLGAFGRARVSYAGTPGEVIIAGALPRDAARGYAAVARIGQKTLLREWTDVGGHVELVRIDVDADGRREDIFFFRTIVRGLHIETDGRRWREQELGALAEYADSNTDFTAVLGIEDPEGDPPLLLIGGAAWDYRHGFRVRAYRWSEEGCLTELGATVLGEVHDLSLADLDRDGENEVYASFVGMAHTEYRYLFPEFELPGVCRLRVPTLETTPVRTWREPGYIDAAGSLRKQGPYLQLVGGLPITLSGPLHDALVYVGGTTGGGSSDLLPMVFWQDAGRLRQVTLPGIRPQYSYPVEGEFRRASHGVELAILAPDAVVLLGQEDADDAIEAAWRDLPFLRPQTDDIERSLADDLSEAGYFAASARLHESSARSTPIPDEFRGHWRASIRAWLEAFRADRARDALDDYRTACVTAEEELVRGEIAYWRGRIAEEELDLNEAAIGYGHARSELAPRDPAASESAERATNVASLLGDADTLTTSFGRTDADSELPRPWSESDPRLSEFVPGSGLRVVCHDHRRTHLTVPFRMQEGAFRARVVLTLERQDWGGQVDVGVIGETTGPDGKDEGLFFSILRGDPGQRTVQLHSSRASIYFGSMLLTQAGTHDLHWGVPYEFTLKYRSATRVLHLVCRDAIAGTEMGRVRLELKEPQTTDLWRFGIRSGWWDVAYDARSDIVLHHAELDVFGGEILRGAGDPEGDTSPEELALRRAWQAWIADRPEDMVEHWEQARASGADLAPFLVGPFARPTFSFLEALPADLLDERLLTEVLSLASTPHKNPRDPELVVRVFEGRGDLGDEERLTLRYALRRLGRTAEAYALGEPEAEAEYPAVGDLVGALLDARSSVGKLLPKRAIARAQEVLGGRPRIRERIEALIYLAQARLMLDDEDGARDALRRLDSIEAFDAEELKDHADLRRFLRREPGPRGD